MTVTAHERAALVALVSLPELGPARLRTLRAHLGSVGEVYDAVRAGAVTDLPLRIEASRRDRTVREWAARLADLDLGGILAAHETAGVTILTPDDHHWPARLETDPEPPAVLFLRGDPALLAATTVSVVGTRRCTASGAATARELGHGLAAAGVPVISGLALGIDGLVHRSVLESGGRPVGFVATGIDSPYPSRHRSLWNDVADRGLLVSEAALGVGPERWRFPARNRLIAACAAAVVVVESGLTGGSMITADEALDRGVPVLAVPGPVRAPQSAGTNQLIFDGARPVRDANDVLGELGFDSSAPARAIYEVPVPDGCRPVFDLLSSSVTTLGELASATSLEAGQLTTALARLEAAGLIARSGGGYQRTHQ